MSKSAAWLGGFGSLGLWIVAGMALAYLLSPKSNYASAQAAGIPCGSGYLPSQDQSGNWTCLPVG